MKFELRSIKLSKSLSQETPAYTATLFVDGKKAAFVENHGCGGPDNAHFTDRALEAKVDAHFAALPKVKAYGMELPQTLEDFCQNEVWRQDEVKSLKARAKRKVMGVQDGKLYGFKFSLAYFNNLSDERQVAFKERNKGMVFIHDMSDAEIRAYVDAEHASYAKEEA